MDAPSLVLDRVLGVGRTGRVWRARLRTPGLGREAGAHVAVKVLRTEVLSDPDARASFASEVEAGRAVRHPALSRFLYAAPGGPPPVLEGLVPEAHLPRPEQDDGGGTAERALDLDQERITIDHGLHVT